MPNNLITVYGFFPAARSVHRISLLAVARVLKNIIEEEMDEKCKQMHMLNNASLRTLFSDLRFFFFSSDFIPMPFISFFFLPL